ncbi:MAG: CRTAC1 family protein [Planctomycetota bacterium]
MKISRVLLCLAAVAPGCSRSPQAHSPAVPTTPPLLAVRHDADFVAIAHPTGTTGTLIVPLTTRSERRVTATPWMDEVEILRIGASDAAPEVWAAFHSGGTELYDSAEGVLAVGEPKPWPAALEADPLPWIRRDGYGAGLRALTLPPRAKPRLDPDPERTGRRANHAANRSGPDRAPPTRRKRLGRAQPRTPRPTRPTRAPRCPVVVRSAAHRPRRVAQTRTGIGVRGSDRRPNAWNTQPWCGEGPARWTGRRTEGPQTAAGELWRVRLPATTESGQRLSLLVQPGQAWQELPGPRTLEASAPAPAAWLRDVAQEAGLAILHLEGPDLQNDIRPTMGPGAAWGDVDGDGWLDLYLVQGGGREGWPKIGGHLLHNRGDGTFEDRTEAAGVGDTGAGMGALFFDADGDGHLDLYVANYGRDRLFRGKGDGTFEAADAALVDAPELWSAAVSAADYDGDGDLDLYVTAYLDYDPSKMPPADALERFQREDPIEMLPFAFPGQRNTLWRNDSETGKLRFTDVTAELGVGNETGLSMQALWWDFDVDGDPDLYIANDVSPNVMFLNRGDGTFEDISFAAGLDDPRGGMGLDTGDVDGDGDEDLFLSNWELESNALYKNHGRRESASRTRRANFRDQTIAAGLGSYGVGVTSWGVEFFDLELDGDLDLFVANGYTSPDYATTGICVGQPNHLFENDGRGQFRLAIDRAPAALAVRRASRCALAADYDRDGDLDLLVTSNNGVPQLLRNDAPRQGESLQIELAGTGRNPHGIGARVEVRAGERRWAQGLRAGTGYLGGNAPELFFGLGKVRGPLNLEVTWRDGAVTRYEVPRPGAIAWPPMAAPPSCPDAASPA